MLKWRKKWERLWISLNLEKSLKLKKIVFHIFPPINDIEINYVRDRDIFIEYIKYFIYLVSVGIAK